MVLCQLLAPHRDNCGLLLSTVTVRLQPRHPGVQIDRRHHVTASAGATRSARFPPGALDAGAHELRLARAAYTPQKSRIRKRDLVQISKLKRHRSWTFRNSSWPPRCGRSSPLLFFFRARHGGFIRPIAQVAFAPRGSFKRSHHTIHQRCRRRPTPRRLSRDRRVLMASSDGSSGPSPV